jgi:uncharacterized protein YeaO (DUF488 family)
VIKTKRWNDPVDASDGYRLLVCRYRPRGVAREDEPWDAWLPDLGPSQELHAAVYGKTGPPIAWTEYASRYRQEMERRAYWISGFAERVARGEVLTLLCSSACVDPERCHRTLLRDLIVRAAQPAPSPAKVARVVRRRRA